VTREALQQQHGEDDGNADDEHEVPAAQVRNRNRREPAGAQSAFRARASASV
jgi:hypothetical protein